MNKFFAVLLRALPLVPAAIQAAEGIGGAGLDKKGMALSYLGLSSAVAASVAPEFKAEIDAATQVASQAIDNTVAVYNLIGKFKKSTPATAIVAHP